MTHHPKVPSERSTPPLCARQRPPGPDLSPGAMAALADLRPAVDAFFDKVTVNDPDPALRANRLRLLNQLRQEIQII